MRRCAFYLALRVLYENRPRQRRFSLDWDPKTSRLQWNSSTFWPFSSNWEGQCQDQQKCHARVQNCPITWTSSVQESNIMPDSPFEKEIGWTFSFWPSSTDERNCTKLRASRSEVGGVESLVLNVDLRNSFMLMFCFFCLLPSSFVHAKSPAPNANIPLWRLYMHLLAFSLSPSLV